MGLRRRIREWFEEGDAEHEANRQEQFSIVWAISEAVASPLVSRGTARLTHVSGRDPARGLGDVAMIEPVREGSAAIHAQPEGAWIDIGIGGRWPDSTGHFEFEVWTDDWPARLESVVRAVIEGRYLERSTIVRSGCEQELIFELPGGDYIEDSVTWAHECDESERRFKPYE